MLKITHLIPYDGIGGVEAAARTFPYFRDEDMEFKTDYIFDTNSWLWKYLRDKNIIDLLSSVLYYCNKNNDVLIVSLWRACIVGLLVKIWRRRMSLILFLHDSEDSHFCDWLFTRLAASVADEIWVDSNATLTRRGSFLQKKRRRIISFVARRFEASLKEKVEPFFIFWGRLATQKGLERAIRLFAEIRKNSPGAKFTIIGPDMGCLHDLRQTCGEMGLANSVSFVGPAEHAEIANLARKACFYLQTSAHEGMAMSVVEAMQMGLVPVVTGVGEIVHYCRHGLNAIIVETDEQAIGDVQELLNSNARYQRLRSASIEAWKEKPLYRESMLNACKMLGPSLTPGH